ncbi:M24 family metallopeptidase [Clostridiaceae bacterium]|nr:M24 family metallopeptidase [Clostridiaceae bacterium]
MNQTNKKIEALRRLMRKEGIDAYLVPTADFHESEYVGEYFKCRQFLTGFNGTAGTAVFTMNEAGLWTDGRYFVQAKRQLAGSFVTLYQMGSPGVPAIEEFLKDRLPEGGCLGFDGRTVNDESGRVLLKALEEKKAAVSYKKDLAGAVWENRPALSCRPIWILEERYAGKAYKEKLCGLRLAMQEQGADVHIMTALDEIAWLFNLRGGDVLHNPVFLSNALVGRDTVTLYVQLEALSKEVSRYLQDNQVEVKPYDAFYDDVAALRNQAVLLERKKVSYLACESIDVSCRIINAGINPCAAAKAVKNETEIENIRRAHIKDGVAVTKFMYWLKHTIGTCGMTEMTAARKMEELRSEQDGYLGPSFVTGASYRENAAMCHYHPSDGACSELKARGFLLVDSGGHYYEGTTDITRTFALGPLTDEEREIFTVVAMSMLKAGDMKFLYGCRGMNLDYTIREALWKRGLDFSHGTGHGVGYVLNVHERPNGLRWKIVPERQDSAVIEPGMICSVEPGMYFEGKFGTRTENLVLCVPDEKNEYGQFLRFEFLTWAPIDLEAIDTRFMDELDIKRLNAYHAEVYQKISPFLRGDEKTWLKEATRQISVTM